MNHRLNARVNRLPECPECKALALAPCTTTIGGSVVREPHNIRLQVARGEVAIVARPISRGVHELKSTIASLKSQWWGPNAKRRSV